jgi:hypothetical protein
VYKVVLVEPSSAALVQGASAIPGTAKRRAVKHTEPSGFTDAKLTTPPVSQDGSQWTSAVDQLSDRQETSTPAGASAVHSGLSTG